MRTESRNQTHPPCRAMTLIEMTITVCIMGVALFLLNGWMSSLRASVKHDLARRMLTDLDEALVRYRRSTGYYPMFRGPESAIPAVVDLLDHDKTRPIIEAFPSHLWSGPGRQQLVDPWGTPLIYLSLKSDDPRVAANGGRPLFVSAGPDRDFGKIHHAAIGDNLGSDDPGPEGFRIHDALRAVLAGEEESPIEQEDDPEVDQDAEPTRGQKINP